MNVGLRDQVKVGVMTQDHHTYIETLIEQALAEVWAVDVTEVRRRRAEANGPLEVDSHVAEAVLGKVEGSLGREIPGVDDLDPEDIATVEQLIALAEKLQELS